MITTLGPVITQAVARVYWRLSRWTLKVEPQPDVPRILIGAPHTSNWDFIFMIGIGWRTGTPLRWLGKHSLFKGWRGPIMRAFGGMSVDRSDPGAVVAQIVEAQRKGSFSLVITPEGTRGAGSGWKSGFYRIAREADLPVTLGFVDRTTMTVGLGPTLTMTGDVAADMTQIREFYADKSGFDPKRRGEVRLRSESTD